MESSNNKVNMRVLSRFLYNMASAISAFAFVLIFIRPVQASTNFCTNMYYSQESKNPKSNALIEIIKRIKTAISPVGINPEELYFTASKLNALDLKFLQDSLSVNIQKLVRGDEIQVIQPEDIPYFVRYQYGVMELLVMNELEQSRMNSLMSEVYKTKKAIVKIILNIRLRDGSNLQIPYKANSIGSEDDLLAAESNFYMNMYKQFGNLEEVASIELTIIQPYFDVIIQRKGLSKKIKYFNSIKENEILAIEKWAQRLPSGKQIFIKKLLPNGYYYMWSTKTGLK